MAIFMRAFSKSWGRAAKARLAPKDDPVSHGTPGVGYREHAAAPFYKGSVGRVSDNCFSWDTVKMSKTVETVNKH